MTAGAYVAIRAGAQPQRCNPLRGGNVNVLAVAQIEADPGRLADSIAAHVRMAHVARDYGAEFILFPELSLTGYTRCLTSKDAIASDDPVLRPLAETSQTRGIVITVGAPMSSSGGLLICCHSFFPDGRMATHTKQHLHDGEEVTFVAGTGGPLLSVGGTRIGLAICADINHSAHIEHAHERGATVYAASCFLTPAGYATDCHRLAVYAKRHEMVVLMANYIGSFGGFESAGGSSIWDTQGRLVAAAPRTGNHLVLAEVEKSPLRR